MGSSDRRKSFDSLLKMDISRWLSLILAVLTYTTPVSSSQPRVVCYYTNWSVYRPGTARFNPQNINPYLCTHLIYAFGGFTKDNTLKPFDKYQDIEKGGYAKFTGLKTYNKNLKTLLAIGGWNEGSTRFSPMVAARDRRKEFVRNAIKFLRQNRFDGLDLDWEYPAFRDGGKPKDRENYAKLVKELREEFEKESEKTNKPRLLLTMAVPAGIEYIQKGFDVRTLNKYLDWMNLLTYDYHSAFEPAVNHHAPLFPLEEPNEYSVDNELNIDYTIKFYLENGADRDKLVLGIPTYGRSYTLFNADAVEIGSPADGPGDQGDATREKGYLAYYEICEALKAKTKKRNADSDEDSEEDSEEEVDEPWTVMYPNPNAMGPVAYKGNQWVGYDDIEIVRRKAEYVAENGLGGIMFWSIDNDDFRGNCHEKPYPLIEAAKESYIAKLGSTHNVIVTEKPASSNRNRKKRPRTTSTTTTAKPSPAAKTQSNKRTSLTSTTPAWNVITPEPPTTPDPGSDFKCTDEGFFPHPRDCKKYFWCLDSGPSNLGIVAHQFTCPSGLFFNKAADSCDFARNVLCKKPAATTKAPTTKTTVSSTTSTTTTTRKPIKLSTKSSSLFRTTSTTTPEPENEEEYDNEFDSADVDAEDPRVIKELIDLIKKVGGVEQLEKHLKLSDSSGSQLSTDGAVTTTVSPIISKKLYQKVLERTRGRNKYANNNEASDNFVLNSRRGPQNAGLESTQDKDKLFRKDRPQYTTINRLRSSTSTTEEPQQSEESEEEPTIEQQPLYKSRAIETQAKVGTTAKPLQYVNIRRAKPTTTSDTADDTASRNALFERSEAYVTVSEGPTIDIASARRENIPEYVTIRRQRPTTEETTTVQYQTFEPKESQEETFEKEITQSAQPQYTSIVRARSTTVPPLEEPSSPAPTTVLAVQISSLLNSPSSVEAESPEPETSAPAEVVEPTTTTSTTLSTTTTTAVPSSLPTRRTVLRRRGSTTSTTTTPSTTTQGTNDRRTTFQRRTKATAPPEAETETEPLGTVETTTNKYTRRGNSKFKTRKGAKDVAEENRTKRPSFGGNGSRNASERPTRNFVRRRLGGANATTTIKPATSSTSTVTAAVTRRPFRIASRRRPFTTTVKTSTTTTTEPTTVRLASEESLQDISDADYIEDPSLKPRAAPKTPKLQRRPLVTLKDEEIKDQNPSATNEEEKKRQSKKYSSTFKQNQLDEVLKRTKSQEESDTTTEGKTTVEDYNAETAVAIAAHQLLAAPIPITQNFDEITKPARKSVPTTTEFRYTKADYTESYIDSKKPTYTNEYSSTPIYKTSTDYITSTGVYTGIATDFAKSSLSYNPETTGFSKSATFNTDPSIFAKTTAFTPESTIFGRSTAGYNSATTTLSKSTPSYLPETSGFTKPTSRYSVPTGFTKSSYGPETSTYGFTSRPSFPSTLLNRPSTLNPDVSVSPGGGSSTAKYLSTSEKYISLPVEDFGYSTSGYSSSSQDPSYFTREYLLESPVTKTYDEEYQYLSPVTKQQTTTRRSPQKKTVTRKISTTIKPTTSSFEVPVTTPKPRRVPSKKPFEKIPVQKSTYRPIENYDYYDDGVEKLAEKYAEGTKVVVHGKGTIECLDIGNFPHPTSCKKFISCARIENGSLLGWEYICPKGLSFDPVGGICNWSAGLGCDEKDI